MALTPQDEAHALQIQAGVLGRFGGHDFEDRLTAEINKIGQNFALEVPVAGHLVVGDPAVSLLRYVLTQAGQPSFASVVALSTGALATSEDGRKWLMVNGVNVRRCKSDIVLTATFPNGELKTYGLSTKQCNNRTPTNAQLFFTTATAFVLLLRNNGIEVSDAALTALRRFCGDVDFRPLDEADGAARRVSDPRRWFWEELPSAALAEWEALLAGQQDAITRLLLQKAYIDDPFVPDFVLHKTRLAPSWGETEIAIYTVDELVSLSAAYQGFQTKPYSVRKGSYPDPKGVTHSAPRFGVVQMQRGGQAQHPTQLQFNLEAGYFYRLENL